MSEDKSKCRNCWKWWIWACPLLISTPKNIISCSAYEPNDVYLKEQELTLKFIEDLGELESYAEAGVSVWHYIINMREKWEKKNE